MIRYRFMRTAKLGPDPVFGLWCGAVCYVLLPHPGVLPVNKRKLLGDLCRLALRALARYFKVVTGSALTPGVIAAIQTFGDRINIHPHIHFLATEGGVDAAGVFHKIPCLDDSRLAEIFAREVLSFLVGRVNGR